MDFENFSLKLKKKYRWQKYKTMMIVGGISLVFLVVVYKIVA